MKRQCGRFQNITSIHQWLCERAGPDNIATYRVEEVMMDLNITKPSAVQSLRRLVFAGAVENITKAKVQNMLLRVDLIRPAFTPQTWDQMVAKAKAIKAKQQAYRPLPEVKGYRDPYSCAAPLLAHIQANADADGIFGFNLHDLADFGTDAIILATIQYLTFKKRLMPITLRSTDVFKNYTVKIMEVPHAT